jgi:hypothetical protein
VEHTKIESRMRLGTSIYVQDRIRKPLMKFKKAMRKVTDCDPTGCDEAAIMNMACALYNEKTD